jgi:mono/diheme cytochrome c family protein
MRKLLVSLVPLIALASTACGGKRVDDILALPADASAGESVYSSTCGTESCHGSDGSSGAGADLTALVPTLSDSAIGSAIVDGVGSMPAQDDLSDQQIADVIAYLNETFS